LQAGFVVVLFKVIGYVVIWWGMQGRLFDETIAGIFDAKVCRLFLTKNETSKYDYFSFRNDCFLMLLFLWLFGLVRCFQPAATFAAG